MDDARRRQVLQIGGAALLSGLAGCSGLGGGDDESDIQDSDGDGVIDSEDYAPQDASVQDAADVEEVNSPEQPEDNQDQSPESNAPNTGTVVIDDFESGSLSSKWRDVFDTSNVGTDAGRSVFTVQSSAEFERKNVLAGDRSPYSEGGSTITRDDFTVRSDGTTISFHAKLGEAYTSPGRPNSVTFRSTTAEEQETGRPAVAVSVTQRLDRAANKLGFIADESLNAPALVELRNISFQDQQVGEVVIDSETVNTNVEFNADADISSIDMVVVSQGHWRQTDNIAVEQIQYSV